MGHQFGMPIRFGRRRTPLPPPFEIRARHVRRGVAALHALPPDARVDPDVRARCLVHALRGEADGMPIERLVLAVSTRIAAFESMIAGQPQLLGGRKASAELEQAVYVAMATEPLLEAAGGRRFDPPKFMRRVEEILGTLARRRVVEAAAPLRAEA
jgi:hypothetical protein